VENFKQKQKEELEMFLQQQKEAERAFLLQQEEEVRKKQEEEVRKKQEEATVVAKKQGCESESVTVLLDILAELRSLKQMYQASLSRPKRKRPSRAKQPNPTVTTSAVPPLVISTKSLTGTTSPEIGLGRGKGIRQLKMISSRF
jgi:hypothetical protein